MKKKERAHLKQDPFINFIEKILAVLKKFKKEISIGIVICITFAIVFFLILFFKSQSASRENQLYARSLDIMNSKILSVEKKITGLNELKSHKGISSVVKVFVATLYYENGEFQKAQDTLKNFNGSSLKLINDQKKLLEAEILNAMAKEREAIDILNKMLADGKSEIPPDFILLRIAKIEIKAGHKQSAVSILERLINEFPESFYSNEARSLLQSLH
jgi:predicted negative regulator of RcsB-dependent stress response